MPFTLIKGTFHVVGYSPDGDSLRFKARNIANWSKLVGKYKVNLSKGPKVQLRVEGIDSLETHYSRSPVRHQPEDLADEATDELLKLLKIRNVVWSPKRSRVRSADDGVDGYILAREAGTRGRPICFVFQGDAPETDGSDVFLDAARVRKSVNYAMMKVGHAYPLYYDTLFFDLRQELSKAVQIARAANLGVWARDTSEKLFKGTNVNDLENNLVIWPKLFRRLIKHKRSGQPMSRFADRLAREKITIIPTVHHTRLDTAVEIQGNQLRLLHPPEDLVVGSVIR